MGTLLLAAGDTKVVHQFSRLQAMTEWWQWLLLGIVCLFVVSYIAVTYYFDSVELPRALRWLLLTLRVLAFGGILFYFLDLEKRSERQLTKPSRMLVLVDTSLSMGIQDDQPSGSGGPQRRRIDGVVEQMLRGDLVRSLQADHDVVVYRFDQGSIPTEVASFPRVSRATTTATDVDAVAFHERLRSARVTAAIAGVIIGVGVLSLLASLLVRSTQREDEGSWVLLAGMVTLVAGLVVMATANLRYPDIDFLATLGLRAARPPAEETTVRQTMESADDKPVEPASIAWRDELNPRGGETRLGDAVRYVVQRERGGPIAGVLLITDGGNNAGTDADQAAAVARDSGIKLFAIGLGGDKQPANVRLVDLEAPSRVFPGDGFNLTTYLQAYGLAGRGVGIELVSTPETEQGTPTGEATLEEERRVTLAPDGEILTVKFEVTPQQAGRRVYQVRIVAPAEDQDARDDTRSASVEIVERQNRVLLLASGPTREFIFLRNLLFRDRETTVDVCLQSGQPGISQDADDLLYEFPKLADELFEYDCIVAFDPDWTALDEQQIQLLERWVAEKAGGLIVVSGPVETPTWASRVRTDRGIDIVKGLYPVVFYGRGSATLGLARFASETPWPLQFTSDGRDAEFLWLEDDALLSEQAWSSFEGVYGYYAVKDPKPGARVYARFADPNTAIDGELPIYLAGHFYGAGRVFFQASGEMWRVRAVDEGYFESYYTKLIRWVSQGRLLRDSSRGVLLVDKDRCMLGDHITVQAILNDAQHQPLTADRVSASLLDPDGRRVPLELLRVEDAARPGMYSAQFTAVLEGDYRVELQPPHGAEGELLRREVRSRIPALETEQPQRNDSLLKNLADKTGGAYYVGFATALQPGADGRPQLVNLIAPQDQITYLSGTPDKRFERLLMTWLMGLICGVLCLEWLIRRLTKLS